MLAGVNTFCVYHSRGNGYAKTVCSCEWVDVGMDDWLAA